MVTDFISVCMGVSCAGLSGLRSTVPLFMLGLFARNHPTHIALGNDYQWLSTMGGLILLGILMVLEAKSKRHL